MARNLGSADRLPPLSAGNVVSAGLRLYRSHLKTYLKLALFAYLWILVPVYGWAKYCVISALISRLAYGELINQPEGVEAARQQLNPRLWSFFGLALLVGLIFLGVYVGLILAGLTVGAILGFTLGGILTLLLGANWGSAIGGITAGLLIFILVLAGILWFVSRLLIPEVPLAVEENVSLSEAIARSWELTKAAVVRIQGVVAVAFLVTLPILLLTNYIPSFLLSSLDPETALFWALYPLTLIVSFAGGIFTLPFWQAIKAVVYYDLRTRREGIDLRLRDS